jgi:hypothetical protein
VTASALTTATDADRAEALQILLLISQHRRAEAKPRFLALMHRLGPAARDAIAHQARPRRGGRPRKYATLAEAQEAKRARRPTDPHRLCAPCREANRLALRAYLATRRREEH